MTLAKKLLMGSGSKSNGYVEFVSSTAMTITPKYTNSGVTLQYSLNCTTWTTILSGTSTPSANIIYFRGRATAGKTLFSDNQEENNAWTFSGATNLECNGKLDRLLQDAFGNDFDLSTLGNSCFASMFYNVNALIKAPSLPATTLGSYCYNDMFKYCTSLTTAPSLPATTLGAACYYGMFQGCSSLKLSTTMTGIYDTAYRIPKTGTGKTETNALTNMFTATGGTFTGTPTINTTYYTENTPV